MVLCIPAQAQSVSNIRSEQREQEIVVFYSLETWVVSTYFDSSCLFCEFELVIPSQPQKTQSMR